MTLTALAPEDWVLRYDDGHYHAECSVGCCVYRTLHLTGAKRFRGAAEAQKRAEHLKIPAKPEWGGPQ